MFSFYFYFEGAVAFHKRDYPLAYEMLVKSLQGNKFHPVLHQMAL